MPDQTRLPTTTTTPTTTNATETTPEGGAGNSFMSDLLSGKERLDGDPATYFANGVKFQRGMRGKLVERIQEAIGAGIDGGFGGGTEAKLKIFQKANGLAETGVVDQTCWSAISAKTATLKNLNGEEDFARMWAAHPHNYQADETQNTTSEALRDQLGMKESDAPNTCALRMSTMLNRMGGKLSLTTGKGNQAGLNKMRPGGLFMPKVKDPETESKDDRAIVSAKEMWTYVEHHRGKPDLTFPPRGRYKTQEEADAGAKEAEAAVAGKKGLVAFDKIYGYGGSGHVDLFDGTTLSDGSWYPSEVIKLWFVVKGT